MTAFTICSNNYLAFAKTLGDSWLEVYPCSDFFIFIVDRPAKEIDYSKFKQFKLVFLEELQIEYLDELLLKYSIVELNTCIKPDCFIYLFEKFSKPSVVYLDPDIYVFRKLEAVEKALLDNNNFVLTPHILTPYQDIKSPNELNFLQTGIFNLGFLAVRNSSKSLELLFWWKNMNRRWCYSDISLGCFTDQKWMNFIPVFDADSIVLRHLGYNVANWNLHERTIHNTEGELKVNRSYDFVFFHFSNFNFSNEKQIAKYNSRIKIDDNEIIERLYVNYKKRLTENGHEQYSVLKCYFYKSPYKRKFKKLMINRLKFKA